MKDKFDTTILAEMNENATADLIDLIDPLSVAPSSIDALMKVIENTSNNRVRDTAAVKIADVDINFSVDIEPIIRTIDRLRYSKHISSLIFCCSEFDCSQYLEFFCHLLIDLDDQSFIEAIGVIENMNGPFKKTQKENAIAKLKTYSKKLKKTDFKKEYIQRVINLISE